MKRILVIQPLAMGDLLMTTQLLAGLRATHPGAGICVMANDSFARVLAHNPAVDQFIPFPYVELYRRANQPANQAPAATLSQLARFVESFTPGFDLVLNPCFNDLAGALTFLSRGRQVVGADFSKEGYLIMRGDWPSYMRMVWGEPCANTFHTTDLHCLAAGARPPQAGLRFYLTKKDRQDSLELLGELGAKDDDRLIALHLGATRKHKRWPLENFIELGRLLSAEGFRPVLTGGAAEAETTAQAAQGMGPGILQAAGKTENLGVLACLLRRCQALISNDSGPIHVAVAAEVPVISISLGKVQFRATGPYLPGSLALEADMDCAPCVDPDACPHQDCRRAVRPQDALAALKYILGGPWQPPSGRRTRFYQAETAPDGLLDWRPMHADEDQALHAALRRAWLEVLQPGSDIMAPKPARLAAPGSEPWSAFDALAYRAVQVLEKMLALVSSRPDISALSALSAELADISRRIRDLGMAESRIKPLAAYLILRKASLDQDELAIQITSQLNLYKQARRVARLAAQQLQTNQTPTPQGRLT